MSTKSVAEALTPEEVEAHKEDVRRLRRARDLAVKAFGALGLIEDAGVRATAERHLELFDEFCESKALEKIEAVRLTSMGGSTLTGARPEGRANA